MQSANVQRSTIHVIVIRLSSKSRVFHHFIFFSSYSSSYSYFFTSCIFYVCIFSFAWDQKLRHSNEKFAYFPNKFNNFFIFFSSEILTFLNFPPNFLLFLSQLTLNDASAGVGTSDMSAAKLANPFSVHPHSSGCSVHAM